jgi:hypothetical protein
MPSAGRKRPSNLPEIIQNVCSILHSVRKCPDVELIVCSEVQHVTTIATSANEMIICNMAHVPGFYLQFQTANIAGT